MDGPRRTIRTWEFNVNGLDTRTAVLLLAGAGATYIAFLHPAVGVAVLVGLAVVGLLHTLMR
ncbi:hypothetical protein OG754_40440 (plasmid) [Streptomyces decoyicus]|uniref:hypothetical protein n=1 Tax=Streptomyces decoyicus TaxID=249567 RepID=UPI002E30A4E1|nr:hypothetical protein [Streptomyces decoyicus]